MCLRNFLWYFLYLCWDEPGLVDRDGNHHRVKADNRIEALEVATQVKSADSILENDGAGLRVIYSGGHWFNV